LNEKLSDNDLRAALEQDSPAAVELIWDRYANDLLTYLKCVLCSTHDAEDVLQTVFVRIVSKRQKLGALPYNQDDTSRRPSSDGCCASCGGGQRVR
jgi:DNA-directed RNA polymerase specialized sigma24 family protein